MKPCNKCNVSFVATSPFNRTCPDCSELNAKVSKRGGSPGSGLPDKTTRFTLFSVKEIPEIKLLPV